ncbi:uncharacterized protein LOC112565224 isoform X2 [Pomacea canaliculata]|uniref:uncharacterized protein LOC112565224 isoform X2 n=1 Tax=Pomacea canaliculata TaxID=400727 RepID=UPI000D73D769|nr:uncharacterized protein LOC112565224 isoform X2 [Pomacea canaliculata]
MFDSRKLLMTVGIGSRERLQLTWRTSSLFLFSTNYWTTLPTVLTTPDNTSNRDMLMAKLDQPYHTFTNMSGSSIWMGFSRHLFFIGISFNRTKSGEIVKFQLYYSIQADCSKHYRDTSIFQPYLDDTAQSPNTFSLTYLDEGNNTTAVVVLDTTTAATCLWISVLEQVQPSSHDISVYTTSHDVLDAPIFALQWWLDSTSSPEPNIASTTAVTSSTTYNIMTTSSCTTTTVCEMTSPDVLTTNTMPTETMQHTVSKRIMKSRPL